MARRDEKIYDDMTSLAILFNRFDLIRFYCFYLHCAICSVFADILLNNLLACPCCMLHASHFTLNKMCSVLIAGRHNRIIRVWINNICYEWMTLTDPFYLLYKWLLFIFARHQSTFSPVEWKKYLRMQLEFNTLMCLYVIMSQNSSCISITFILVEKHHRFVFAIVFRHSKVQT